MIISGARESVGNVDVSMGSVRQAAPVFRVFTSMQFLSLARSEMPSESGVSS